MESSESYDDVDVGNDDEQYGSLSEENESLSSSSEEELDVSKYLFEDEEPSIIFPDGDLGEDETLQHEKISDELQIQKNAKLLIPSILITKPYVEPDISTTINRLKSIENPTSSRRTILLAKDELKPSIPERFNPESSFKHSETHFGNIGVGSRVKFTIPRTSVEGLLLSINSTFFKILDIVTDKPKVYNFSDVEYIVVEDELPEKYKQEVPGYINVNDESIELGLDNRLWGEINDHMVIGKIIKFDTVPVNITGVVFGITPNTFKISDDKSIIYNVSLNDQSIKKIERTQKSYELTKIPTPDELMNKNVSSKLRKLVVDILFKSFSNAIPYISENIEETKIKALSDKDIAILEHGIMPWGPTETFWKGKKGLWIVIWEFEGIKYKKEFPFRESQNRDEQREKVESFAENGYYSTNFRSWMYSKYSEIIKKSTPHEEIYKHATAIAQNLVNPDLIIGNLLNKYGGDIFNLDGLEFKIRIEEYKGSIEIIDAYIKNALEKLSTEDLEEMKGLRFASFISEIIEKYIKRYPPNVEFIKNDLVGDWIFSEFSKIYPSDEDRNEFEVENIERLKNTYSSFLKEYSGAKKRSEDIKMQTEISESISFILGDVEKNRYDISVQVEKFEQDCYALVGGDSSTIFDYLVKIVTPLAFIDDLKQEARFFNEKLKHGMFQISSLNAANLAHLFPELAMSFKTMPDKKWNMAINEISRILTRKIYNILDSYIYLSNPTSRLFTRPTRIFHWKEFLVSISEKCNKDTLSGEIIKRDVNGKVLYHNVKGMMHPEKSPISLADMTICYDEDSSLFTCHSIDEVIRSISIATDKGTDPINPFTGKLYPDIFINKMKERYADKISEKYEELESPESPWKAPFAPIAPLVGKKQSVEPVEKEPKTMNELRNLLSEDIMSVVYFYNYWCKPCKNFANKWNAMKDVYKDKLNFISVNEDDGAKIIDGFKNIVVPSLLFLKRDGKKIKKYKFIPGVKGVKKLIKKYAK